MHVKCHHCKRQMERPKHANHPHATFFCATPECQEAKKAYRRQRDGKLKRQNEAKHRVAARNAQTEDTRTSWRKKPEGVKVRLCQRCGKDAWPNYRFCPTCHKLVTKIIDCDILESAGFGGGRHTMFGRQESRVAA